MKQRYLFILLLFILFSRCNTKNKNEFKQLDTVSQIDTVLKSELIYNEQLKNYLDKPLDFEKFRKQKNHNEQSHGINPKSDIYFKPDTVGFYYRFFMFERPAIYSSDEWIELCKEDGIRVIVYMFGREIKSSVKKELIEIKSRVNDPDLLESNFVGMEKIEITSKFGKPYLETNSFLHYVYENKMISLNMLNDSVIYFRYLKTNMKIDSNMIENHLDKVDWN